jgi:FAD/FMN-containing dehydrogenase
MILDRLIEPGDTGYDEARKVWNGMIDRRPALIVECAGAADVIAALDLARDRGLGITVRGGGHSVAGKAVADGAVLIDLSAMNSVSVDPSSRLARVGAGATWGGVDRETQAFGLAVTGGVDSRTGVGGLTLGGGVGYLARSFGLTVDHLTSADVVLADGRMIMASEEENPDLFWALRGGGGNFGIVTNFSFRLNALGPQVMTAQVFHEMDDAEVALRHYRDFQLAAPDEVSCYALFVNVPPVDVFPSDRHGRTALALVACHSGPLEQGELDLAPLSTFGDPMLAVLAPMPYATLQSSFNAGAPSGGRYYWKAQYLEVLSDEAISTLVSQVDPLPGAFSNIFIEPMGGAISRLSPTATAFPHRNAVFGMGISSGREHPEDDGRAIEWTRQLHRSMEQFSSNAVYSNYVDHDESDRVEAVYGQNLKRLQHVKMMYDPDNVFDANQNIVPIG